MNKKNVTQQVVGEGGRRQEAGGRRQEAGGRRQVAGGRWQEAGGRIVVSCLPVGMVSCNLHPNFKLQTSNLKLFS
ncbi:MAG: hypothetical protein HY958_03200 [Bacteroidia bacterium]|nr:hypothetical protein [Bacteroidia bacterium]